VEIESDCSHCLFKKGRDVGFLQLNSKYHPYRYEPPYSHLRYYYPEVAESEILMDEYTSYGLKVIAELLSYVKNNLTNHSASLALRTYVLYNYGKTGGTQMLLAYRNTQSLVQNLKYQRVAKILRMYELL